MNNEIGLNPSRERERLGELMGTTIEKCLAKLTPAGSGKLERAKVFLKQNGKTETVQISPNMVAFHVDFNDGEGLQKLTYEQVKGEWLLIVFGYQPRLMTDSDFDIVATKVFDRIK